MEHAKLVRKSWNFINQSWNNTGFSSICMKFVCFLPPPESAAYVKMEKWSRGKMEKWSWKNILSLWEPCNGSAGIEYCFLMTSLVLILLHRLP